MALKRVLENWDDYDNRKKVGEDRRYFSCTEDWERRYLIDKVLDVYPNIGRERIIAAIESCCKAVPAPRVRAVFVECVLRRLGLI